MNRHKNQSALQCVPNKATNETLVLSTDMDTRENTTILHSLEPFLHLLPDLSGIDLEAQKHLYAQLYAAGVNAAFSLQKFICDTNSSGIPMTGIDQEGADWKAVFLEITNLKF